MNSTYVCNVNVAGDEPENRPLLSPTLNFAKKPKRGFSRDKNTGQDYIEDDGSDGNPPGTFMRPPVVDSVQDLIHPHFDTDGQQDVIETEGDDGTKPYARSAQGRGELGDVKGDIRTPNEIARDERNIGPWGSRVQCSECGNSWTLNPGDEVSPMIPPTINFSAIVKNGRNRRMSDGQDVLPPGEFDNDPSDSTPAPRTVTVKCPKCKSRLLAGGK